MRYILDDESKDFLNSIIDTCEERTQILKKGSSVVRAQNGYDLQPYYQKDPETGEDIHVDDIERPYQYKRMKPLENSASEGRANPKGIPCLYVATDKETAMSEVRPWLGSVMSVGLFKITRDLRIIVFATDKEESIHNHSFYFSEPSDEEIIKSVWFHIDNAFSKPTKTSDLKSDYAPTQIISEFIKSKGYDGIAYRSSLGGGHNIALFDLESADIVSCTLFHASKINFEFERSRDPY
ncbi:RES domain-containing protein [Aliivibrio salmonicida]|uniref:RES domain-containing protein n=1 Tax=Aliivibrio salmonicida (strain LFI1238) TaxID=316275 RepID=B6ERF8_ALISL|nr:RES family NAD+ phosphorylase [Aliivibrio salmonicida]AZL86665.1 RES domain-containing protein [Aliivibrio salmonicida]CAQ81291.1 hypothetical protein, putative phage gene [Aliivibrio salmonicida LFI1238]